LSYSSKRETSSNNNIKKDSLEATSKELTEFQEKVVEKENEVITMRGHIQKIEAEKSAYEDTISELKEKVASLEEEKVSSHTFLFFFSAPLFFRLNIIFFSLQ